MKTCIVIPARYHSSRFPGKPLAIIKGHSLLYRVWSLAKSVSNVDEVYIATDHDAIAQHAEAFGAKVIKTNHCQNGTERVYKAVSQLTEYPDIIFNLQGDAVLTPPWIVQDILKTMQKNSTLQLATPAVQISPQQYQNMQLAKTTGEVGGTMLVCDKNHNVMYFSKRMIPFIRNSSLINPPLYRHIGLYAYRYPMLQKYMTLAPTPLETLEELEPLRFLENALPIKAVIVDYKARSHASVDSPEDIARVESLIEKEGELIKL